MSGVLPEEVDRSADIIDQAEAATATFTQRAIDEVTAKAGPESHPDFDGEHCIDCGTEIPAGRLAIHKIRCIDCQSALERRAKQHR